MVTVRQFLDYAAPYVREGEVFLVRIGDEVFTPMGARECEHPERKEKGVALILKPRASMAHDPDARGLLAFYENIARSLALLDGAFVLETERGGFSMDALPEPRDGDDLSLALPEGFLLWLEGYPVEIP